MPKWRRRWSTQSPIRSSPTPPTASVCRPILAAAHGRGPAAPETASVSSSERNNSRPRRDCGKRPAEAVERVEPHRPRSRTPSSQAVDDEENDAARPVPHWCPSRPPLLPMNACRRAPLRPEGVQRGLRPARIDRSPGAMRPRRPSAASTATSSVSPTAGSGIRSGRRDIRVFHDAAERRAVASGEPYCFGPDQGPALPFGGLPLRGDTGTLC